MGELDALGVPSELILIKTKGDKIQNLSFDKIEGKGFFTKEIEDQLLQNKIDIAIHSHKDLETEFPAGLKIAGVSYREDPAELLLIRKDSVDSRLDLEFKTNAVVGTSSARRKAQVLSLRPDITLQDIRGNVPTRVNKLREGQFDAIMLAKAGINRLNLDISDLHAVRLDERKFIPAPAQGVLAYQCRIDDDEMQEIIDRLADNEMQKIVDIERSILNKFGGGCHKPIGVLAQKVDDQFKVRVTYGQDWDKAPRRVTFMTQNSSEARERFDKLQGHDLPKSAFITKSISGDSYLARHCEAFDVDLVGVPLIEIQPVSFDLPTGCDCVFFSSKNSVKTFFDQVDPTEISGLSIAAFGESTARELYNYVDQLDFVGKGSNSKNIADSFRSFIGEKKALFPVSDISLRSIQAALDPSQVVNVICYSSQPTSRKIESAECYIFTSPSNVHSFFKAGNSIASESKVVAIGPSTGASLSDYGYSPLIAELPEETELWALMAS